MRFIFQIVYSPFLTLMISYMIRYQSQGKLQYLLILFFCLIYTSAHFSFFLILFCIISAHCLGVFLTVDHFLEMCETGAGCDAIRLKIWRLRGKLQCGILTERDKGKHTGAKSSPFRSLEGKTCEKFMSPSLTLYVSV